MSKQSREQSRTERAAAVRAEQARKERNRRIGLSAGIVVLLGAIVAGGVWYGSSSGSSSDPAADTRAVVTAADGAVLVGPADAPTKVVVYEDFQCPYCRQLEDQTRDFLRESAASGKVQVEYRPIDLLQSPYGERGMNAFAAVLAHGTPQAALKLHDLLYEKQPYETQSSSVSDQDILDLVKKAGGSNAEVRAALKTQDTAFFQAAAEVMRTKGITGTPTVYLDGKVLTGSVTEMARTIEDTVSAG